MKTLFLLFSSIMLICSEVCAQTASDTIRMYRGFFDFGATVPIAEGSLIMFQVNTAHGFQILDWVHVGLGAGLRFRPGSYTFPVYFETRFGNPHKQFAVVGSLGGGITVGVLNGAENLGSTYRADFSFRMNKPDKPMPVFFSIGYEMFYGYEKTESGALYFPTTGFILRELHCISVGIVLSFQ